MAFTQKTLLSFFGLLLLLAALPSNATCPPIVPCKTTAEASTIAGSNADTELIQFAMDITTSTNEVAAALMDMANANAGSLSQVSQNISSTNAELSQMSFEQQLKLKRSLSDRKMAFDQQMADATYKANTSVVSPDDTEEEFDLILKFLGDNTDKTMPEVIMALTETVDKDDEGGKVLVQLSASKGICSEEDVQEDGKCSIAKRVYPGAKLNVLFKQCSAQKRILMEGKGKKEARVAANEMTNKKISKAMSTTDSAGAVSSRLQAQLSLSCTPTQFKAGICGDGISPEEYQEDIVIGNIIPNGDVSASNFNTPSPSSANGYITELSDEAKKEIEQQSLNRVPLQDNPNQRVVPIRNTYRNANQVKASMDFIDNLVADDLIPAIEPTDRRKIKNAQYQSRYLSRIAALSMVRMTMTDSMSQRLGDDMRKMIVDGAFDEATKFEIKADSPANKESVLGAGALDMLQDRVDQQTANMQLGSQNGDSANAGNDFIASPTKGDALGKINETLILQSEMLLREYLMNEQSLALESISLSQKVNSPEMVKLMSDLRRGKR